MRAWIIHYQEYLCPETSRSLKDLDRYVGMFDLSYVCMQTLARTAWPNRKQDMSLALEGPGVKDDTELTVSITMRRLGQYKTAWPAVKTTLLQAGTDTSEDLIQVLFSFCPS